MQKRRNSEMQRCRDAEMLLTDSTAPTFCKQVVALSGSYHGDTLGAQEAQAPTAYTGPLQQPWSVAPLLCFDSKGVTVASRKGVSIFVEAVSGGQKGRRGRQVYGAARHLPGLPISGLQRRQVARSRAANLSLICTFSQ